MRETTITLTLGDGTTVSGQTLEEAERELGALKNQQREAMETSVELTDYARATKRRNFDAAETGLADGYQLRLNWR